MNSCEKSRTVKIDIRPLAYDSNLVRHHKPDADGKDLLDTIDYRFLFDHAYDAILLTDFNGRVLASNARASQFFGYADDELSKLNLQVLVAGINDMILATIQETVKNGQNIRIQAFGVLKSGDMSAVEIAITSNGQKETKQFCCLIRNIQSGWQTEQNLNSAYHAMDNTDSGIGIANMQGILIYSNRMMTKILADGDETAVIGKHLNVWFDQKMIVAPVLERIKEREQWSGEHCILIGQKSCWLSITAVPDINSDNELCGMVFSIRDIAEHRRVEIAEQQTARNRTILESFSSICHALGQPATVLLTSIELLRLEAVVDDNMRKEMLNLCYDAVLEMREHLINMSTRCTANELSIRSQEV